VASESLCVFGSWGRPVASRRSSVQKLDLAGDEATGANIVRVARRGPAKQIAISTGLEAGVVVDKVRSLTTGRGLRAATGEYVALIATGILDPARVTRSGVQNAASIAALFLTTEAAIATPRDKAGPDTGRDY